MISGIRLGQIAEHKFVVEAIKNGFNVSRPLNPASAYDFIVEKDHKLFRIQVKSTFSEPYGDQNQYQITVGKSTKAKKCYAENAFDYYAVFVDALDIFHLIPKVLVSSKSLRIHPDRGVCRHGFYRDNWELQ